MITASQLYSYLACPHRASMDAFGDPAQREAPNAFVELLWERGSAFERDTIAALAAPFTDLVALSGDEKETATRAAMARGDALIYGGRLSVEGLLGAPDLLRRAGTGARGQALYVAVDIKSGRGDVGGDEAGDDESGTLKPQYGVQLALYTDILIRLGVNAGRHAFIWDIRGREVRYDFDQALGVRNPTTMWAIYEDTRREVTEALAHAGVTRPAASAVCKMCVWRSACLTELKATRDLTLLPGLGRAKRDVLTAGFVSLEELAGSDVERFVRGGKTAFRGIGPESLRTFQARAKLAVMKDPKPYLKKKLELPTSDVEIFFDIETDPMQDFCYLHGFVIRERSADPAERFVGVFAEGVSAQAERNAFAQAWAVLQRYSTAVVYIYSKYERTIYKKLAAKYPDVCSVDEVERFFASERVVDLYGDVVRPFTEWPTMDFSIKSVAKCLGFQWRDSNPSGAASIEWFQRYCASQDASEKQRILDYNEDDCIAMKVLVDGLNTLEVRAK